MTRHSLSLDIYSGNKFLHSLFISLVLRWAKTSTYIKSNDPVLLKYLNNRSDHHGAALGSRAFQPHNGLLEVSEDHPFWRPFGEWLCNHLELDCISLLSIYLVLYKTLFFLFFWYMNWHAIILSRRCFSLTNLHRHVLVEMIIMMTMTMSRCFRRKNSESAKEKEVFSYMANKEQMDGSFSSGKGTVSPSG